MTEVDMNDIENVAPIVQEQQQTKNTILQYFTKNTTKSEIDEDTISTSSDEQIENQTDQRKQFLLTQSTNNLAHYTMGRELGYGPTSLFKVNLHHRYTSCCSESHTVLLPHLSPQTLYNARFWGAAQRRPPTQAVQTTLHRLTCSAIDAHGQLLLTGDSEGTLAVHDIDALHPPARYRVGNQTTIQPVVAISTCDKAIESVCWNPGNDAEVMVTSLARNEAQIYDLEYTRGSPKRVLTASTSLYSATFFPHCKTTTSYLAVAGGQGGQAFLWDSRTNNSTSNNNNNAAIPVASTLSAPHLNSPPAVSIHVADNGNTVIIGTLSGEIRLWDVRGGSGGALRFGSMVCPHPFIGAVRLETTLQQVPGLLEAVGHIPTVVLRSLRPDPLDPCRLGFHLSCGWSGVFDLNTWQVTHIHAPPRDDLGAGSDGSITSLVGNTEMPNMNTADTMLQIAARGVAKEACWSRDGSRFCITHGAQLQLLDFGTSASSGCSVAALDRETEIEQRGSGGTSSIGGFTTAAMQMQNDHPEDGNGVEMNEKVDDELVANPSAVTVQLSVTGTCVAAHPCRDEYYIGGLHDSMSVVVNR